MSDIAWSHLFARVLCLNYLQERHYVSRAEEVSPNDPLGDTWASLGANLGAGEIKAVTGNQGQG